MACRTLAMQASCSHPVAESVEFSKLLANRRDRPNWPCATSTFQAWGNGLKIRSPVRGSTGFSSQPL